VRRVRLADLAQPTSATAEAIATSADQRDQSAADLRVPSWLDDEPADQIILFNPDDDADEDDPWSA